MQTKKTKILVIQLRQLGDVIMTTPLVRQIKKLYPNSELHFLTEKLGSFVYQYNDNVEKIVLLPRSMNFWELAKTYAKIFNERYDFVIDCFCNPKSAQLTFFSRAKSRIGFHFKGRKYAYNNENIIKNLSHERINEYSALAKLRLIEHLGADLSDSKIEFPISNELKINANNFAKKYFNERKAVALNVVSRKDYKILAFENYIEVANWLTHAGFFVFFTYGPNEYDLAKKVYDGMQQKNLALIDYPMLSVPQLRALLECCTAYVGNDGGIKHLAVCAGIPTFTIFQNINWSNWTPPQSKKDVALTNCLNDKEFYEKCTDKDRCFANLTAREIIPFLQEFILEL